MESGCEPQSVGGPSPRSRTRGAGRQGDHRPRLSSYHAWNFSGSSCCQVLGIIMGKNLRTHPMRQASGEFINDGQYILKGGERLGLEESGCPEEQRGSGIYYF